MHVRTTFKQSILFIQWALLLASNIGKVEYHSCPTGLLLVFLGAAKYKISYVPVHLQALIFNSTFASCKHIVLCLGLVCSEILYRISCPHWYSLDGWSGSLRGRTHLYELQSANLNDLLIL
eukprot:TRINITY_DN55_c1_g1_i1.p1 TRINITY_DN55_c1_g1~~TRINITY_DN55_c1_g1_i1.p1  ORF type:complete len:121 (+),score=0.89 TRINITY_DN55_c1_g1_i1:1703-2065(+)